MHYRYLVELKVELIVRTDQEEMESFIAVTSTKVHQSQPGEYRSDRYLVE